MGETSIEWTDYTFNPWWGCQRVSPGCENCYAETFDHRLGMAHWGPKAPRRFFGDAHWREPLVWQDRRRTGDPRHSVFCASVADVFEDRRDLDAPRARLWELIGHTPELTWQLLTKRPENAARLAPASWATGWPANVWAMTSAEDQQRADERIPRLLRIPAKVRGVSLEPLLGPIDLRKIKSTRPSTANRLDSLSGYYDHAPDDQGIGPSLDWVIVGGESGPGVRPCDVAWIRSIRDQCKAAGVACFIKQLGARPFSGKEENAPGWEALYLDPRGQRPSGEYAVKLHNHKGGNPAEWPEDLRVREFPR